MQKKRLTTYLLRRTLLRLYGIFDLYDGCVIHAYLSKYVQYPDPWILLEITSYYYSVKRSPPGAHENNFKNSPSLPSSIHHSLFLPNFTPSTIYPLPKSQHADSPEVKVTGNLIVAGSQDIRVFEIREQNVAVHEALPEDNQLETANGELDGKIEEDFFDNGPSQVRYLLCIV